MVSERTNNTDGTADKQKGKIKMSNNEILDMLAEIECKMFYAYCANPTDEMKAAHQAAKNALESFAKSAGII